MSARIDGLDKLNHARRLFDAATMAIVDIDEERPRKALDALLLTALEHMVEGLELIQRPEPERMTGGDRNG